MELKLADPWAKERQAARAAGYNDREIESYISQRFKPAPKTPEKKKGRGGFLTSLISEAGGTGGALGGAALGTALLPGIGTLIGAGLGGFLGGTGGRLAENKIRDDEFRVKDALKEGAISGIAGAGPIKLLKGASGAVKGAAKGTGVAQGAEDAISKSFLGNLTGRSGKRLTEAGSGLKADKNVGGVANLEEQAGFMSKYTGTPRQQRVAMEKDMGLLSKQVDGILEKTPTRLDGTAVGQRLKTAMEDLTDERFVDLDLNNPSVAKIIDRYAQKYAQSGSTKGINDITKTLNKTAVRAQEKLVNPAAGVLTAQEQAALALKRAADDVLSQVPEIAPLKKQMAQIFEVTPQVAKASEKGLPVPFLQGLTVKAPVQAFKGAESKVGSALQGASATTTPGVTGFASRIFAGRALDNATQPIEAPVEETALQDPSLLLGEPETSPTAQALPFIQQIIAAGGSLEDVTRFMELTGLGGGASKPLSAEASKVIATANSGLSSLGQLETMIAEGGVPKGTTVPGRGLFGGAGQALLGTTGFDAAADNVADAMVRARTGAAATKEELALYRRLLPQAFDPPEEQARKIQTVRDYFSSIANRTGSAGTDMQSLVGG